MLKMTAFLTPLLLILMGPPALYAQGISEGTVLLSDDFDRFTERTTELGTLPGSDYSWEKRLPLADGEPMETVIAAAAGQLVLGYSSGNRPHDTGVSVGEFTIADAVIHLTVGASHLPDRTHLAIISYRAASPAAAAGGRQPDAYHVEIGRDWSGSRDITLHYGKETIAAADVADSRDKDAVVQVKVAFVGDRHMVWADGKRVIDYWEIEPGRTGPGYVGFGVWYSIGGFDDFRLSEAKLEDAAHEPPTVAGQMRPLMFQGRPFFVLGTYNNPGDDDLQDWLAAGANTTLFAVLGEGASPEERASGLRESAEWATQHNIAAIYYPVMNMYSEVDGKRTITLPGEIPQKAALLQEMLAVTADHPQTLGYWTFDEPENALYKTYNEWEAKKDIGLAEWMAQGLKWTYDTLKAGDPDAYVMPTIAWWTTYEGLAPLYDVNVPNDYPTHSKDPALTGPLYNVVYDSGNAADAVRAAGRTSFIYMPGIFDNIMEPWRAPTRRELRYLYLAPITQGAMGLLPWRLGRCSSLYRQTVVYPVMRDVSRLIPWFLGEWCDQKVTSDRDTATAGYLKEFPVRVRTVPGEEEVERIEVPGVPDCSYALRRRPDNTYLLLAVSNRKEPITVTFTIRDIQGLPPEALDYMEYRTVTIDDGKITDTFEPFGVRAYIIRPD